MTALALVVNIPAARRVLEAAAANSLRLGFCTCAAYPQRQRKQQIQGHCLSQPARSGPAGAVLLQQVATVQLPWLSA